MLPGSELAPADGRMAAGDASTVIVKSDIRMCLRAANDAADQAIEAAGAGSAAADGGETGTFVAHSPSQSQDSVQHTGGWSHWQAKPIELNMSRLALGVGSSVRLRVEKESKAGCMVLLHTLTCSGHSSGKRMARISERHGRTRTPMSSLILQIQFAGEKVWEFDRSRVQQVRKIGQGTFGIGMNENDN